LAHTVYIIVVVVVVVVVVHCVSKMTHFINCHNLLKLTDFENHLGFPAYAPQFT